MKPLLLVLAALVAALVLTPVAAASGPTPSRPTAADPTSIQSITPSTLAVGIQATLVVTLRDTATSNPVGGASLSFSERTTFGWLRLGNATTNAQGEAGIVYEPASGGTYTIVVSYPGDVSYAPTNTTLTLTAIGAASPPPPLLTPDRIIVLVILAVVGGVWATYGFVAYLILGIRSAGSRTEEESELQEKEIMEEESSGAEAPPKRVPGVANTNRAVVYLAISALVLSGAAVVLLFSGGIAHSAAYTPSTVDLQVTVVPDFRGTTYDSFVPDELIVHAGDTVKITVFNEDTMDHGFAIDSLGVNQVIRAASQDNTTGDITPSVTLISFTVPSAGAFIWYCTNPCGPGHATMTGTLMVLPDD